MPGASPSTATGVTASASYSTGGDKSITLTVTDNAGLTNSVTKTVTVAAAPVDNAPVANFTWSCQGLTCTLDASSSTDDGTIVQYSWNLGRSPNPTATGQVVSAAYAHERQRTVTLTVTDNGGKTGTITKVITVGGAPPPDSPPVASFTSSCNQLTCSLNAAGSTDDGSIVQICVVDARGEFSYIERRDGIGDVCHGGYEEYHSHRDRQRRSDEFVDEERDCRSGADGQSAGGELRLELRRSQLHIRCVELDRRRLDR